MRAVVFVVPIVLSFVVAVVLSGRLATPDGFGMRIGRWLLIAIAATVAMLAAQRLLRRLLPLAALLSLTLVFPDETPSRFGIALRGLSARQLERKLADVDGSGLGETPREAATSLLELVAVLSRHDRMTRGHSERVRAYAVMIGEELELEPDDIDRLRWAALLHDVGKLHVPYEILNKPEGLTSDEFEQVKYHTVVGKEMVAPLAEWLGPSANAVYEHHERWTGGGYPTGVPSEQLPLASRIIAVADAFDVMTSARSYKSPVSAKAARAELQRCAGSQFDPAVVRAMMNISLGRLWRAMGPLSWVAQIGLFPRPVAQGGNAATAAVALVLSLLLAGLAGAAGGGRDERAEALLVTTSTTPETEMAAAPPPPAAPVDDAPAESPDEAPAPVTTSTTTSTTSTTTTSTTVAATTTTQPLFEILGPPPPTTTLARSPITTTPPVSRTATTTTTSTTTSTVASTTLPTIVTSTTIAPTTTPTTTTTVTAATTAPPTTTPPITTPPTTTTTTTTTVPANQFVLASPGLGDQISQPVLDLAVGRPVRSQTLPNFDTDRNGDPGLTLEPVTGNIQTNDPLGVQVWRFPATTTVVDGSVSLQLWIAPASPPGPGQFQVRAGLFDCDDARTACDILVRTTSPDIDAAAGQFEPVDFDLTIGTTPYIVAPGRRLELRVATRNGSRNDAWIGYDSIDTPSMLVITPPVAAGGFLPPVQGSQYPSHAPLTLVVMVALAGTAYSALRRNHAAATD